MFVRILQLYVQQINTGMDRHVPLVRQVQPLQQDQPLFQSVVVQHQDMSFLEMFVRILQLYVQQINTGMDRHVPLVRRVQLLQQVQLLSNNVFVQQEL